MKNKEVTYLRLRTRAISLVRKAVVTGALPRVRGGTLLCVDCGRRATVYDHRDYTKPLDVVPVCGRCNAKRGRAVNFGTVTYRGDDDYRAVTLRLPDDLADKVDERAARDRRSYNTQLIILVEKGLAG